MYEFARKLVIEYLLVVNKGFLMLRNFKALKRTRDLCCR